MKQYNTLPDLALSEDWAARVVAASSDEITEDVAEILSSDEDSDVRGALADNPQTPAHILEKMCKDTDLLVLMTLADNLNTPARGLKQIHEANPDNGEILQSLSTHPNCPEDIRQLILSKAGERER